MKKQIKIEKNIPIPPKWGVLSYVYPWTKMSIGDSIFQKCKTDKEQKSRVSKLLRAADRFCRKNNILRKFTARRVPGGVRVWRIK